jgi:hypothetical protein
MQPPFDPIESLADWPYLAPAAVLTTFAAEELRPLDGARDIDRLAHMLVEYAEPVRIGPARGRWRLRDDVRRRALAALGSRSRVLDALKANIDAAPGDPTQRALVEIAGASTPLKLSGRSLEDLLGIDRATEWLEAADVGPLPSRAEISERLEREKLLAPMRRLAQGFEGRTAEMTALRSYVDYLPSRGGLEALLRLGNRVVDVFRDRPPLMIHGPGGSGKSTLIAQFILEHVGGDGTPPLAFVLLDFDRQALDPNNPDDLLAEIVAQVRTQFPDRMPQLGDIGGDIQSRFATEDPRQVAHSAHFGSSSNVRSEVAEALNEVVTASRQNLLFVVDTFEIVQRRGPSAVFSLLSLIVDLMMEVPRLRVVIAGRGALRREDFTSFTDELPNWTALPIGGFDEIAGRAYLRARLSKLPLLPASDADLDRLVLRVRGNPLGLRLAAQVFTREGLAGVDAAIGRQVINEAIAEEQMQGLLHARIVEHLESENLKRLANPGLIVRRITADVIRDVLAGPCELDFARDTPESLLADLRNEVSLVDSVDDNTLRHRTDVRLIMLPSLRRQLGTTASRIDVAAVLYWKDQEGAAARAEEIYHRLWRGDPEWELERSWQPGADDFLEDALDEFQTIAADDRAHIWLAAKLGRELPDEVRRRADQRAWERDIEQKARGLTRDGRLAEALRVVNERPLAARTAASPLWLLEIDIRQLQGDAEGALQMIVTALDRLNQIVDSDQTLALLSRRTAVFERLDRLPEAMASGRESLAMARAMGKPALIFTCGIAICRLARKTGTLTSPEIAALLAELTVLRADPAVRAALAESPSLLREAAAELGSRVPGLLVDALERLGIETGQASPALDNLPESVRSLATDVISQPSAKGYSGRAIRELAKVAAQRVRTLPEAGTTTLLQDIATLYAGAVDRLLNQILSSS